LAGRVIWPSDMTVTGHLKTGLWWSIQIRPPALKPDGPRLARAAARFQCGRHQLRLEPDEKATEWPKGCRSKVAIGAIKGCGRFLAFALEVPIVWRS
jgi:hypothetical protein